MVEADVHVPYQRTNVIVIVSEAHLCEGEQC